MCGIRGINKHPPFWHSLPEGLCRRGSALQESPVGLCVATHHCISDPCLRSAEMQKRKSDLSREINRDVSCFEGSGNKFEDCLYSTEEENESDNLKALLLRL